MARYRQQSLRCPACAELMQEQPHGKVHVDVCAQCRGIWVDWMDGELQQVAAEVGPSAGGRAPAGPVGPCPHCQNALARESLDGAEVWRCGHCIGAFVGHDAIAIIAGVTPPSAAAPEPAAPWLTQLLDRLGRLVTPG